MTKHAPAIRDLSAQEYRKLILPIAVTSLLVLLAFLTNIWVDPMMPATNVRRLATLIVLSAVYITAYLFME